MRPTVTPRPDRVTSRQEALQLWMHLLDRGFPLHWEEDPAEWTDAAERRLADREVATFRRLIAEVDRLGAETLDCYADADALRRLAMLGVLDPRPTRPARERSPVFEFAAAA